MFLESNKFGLTVLAVLLCLGSEAQQNLVPNPSFEEYSDCPNAGGRIWFAEPWFSVYGTCDYFHECGTFSYGTPGNWVGNENPKDGQGYGQISCYSPAFDNIREFVGLELLDSLQAEVKYDVEFFVSLEDSMR